MPAHGSASDMPKCPQAGRLAELDVDTTYAWSPFDTPSLDNWILYQCHVGSFSGYGDGHVAQGGVAHSISCGPSRTMFGISVLALMPVQEFRFDRAWGVAPP
jgi:1,4-alpha-glucan branching enzyme